MRKLLSLLVFTLLLAAAPALAQGSGLERISFAAGATSAQVSGSVSGTVGKGYALYAFAGQQMDININNATLTVVSPSGSPLVRGTVTADPVRSFSTVLPETGDYLIYITAPAGSGALNYTMNVSIVSGGGGGSAPTAERIRFVPGGTGAVVTGYVAGGNQNSYLLYAFAGQTMTLTLDNGTLTVVSPSGSPLVRGTVTAEPIRSFNMVLPETGDYTIQVSVPASSPAIGYTLAASVTGSISSGSSTPERITFAAGGTSATITGQVSGTVRKSYVLGAFAGQSMTVNVTNAFMTVVSPVGDPMARAQNNAQSLTQTLNDSGDYSIEISVPPATGTVNYTLYVSIVGTPYRVGSAERISFAAGATSARVYGAVSGTIQNSFVLYAFAGQTMTLALSDANLTVVSPSGTPLLRGVTNGEPSTSFVLTETGDYQLYITVPAGSGVVSYALDITITS